MIYYTVVQNNGIYSGVQYETMDSRLFNFHKGQNEIILQLEYKLEPVGQKKNKKLYGQPTEEELETVLLEEDLVDNRIAKLEETIAMLLAERNGGS
jgi:hypothetical protein